MNKSVPFGFNYSKSVRANWAQDIPGNVTADDRNWPRLLQGG